MVIGDILRYLSVLAYPHAETIHGHGFTAVPGVHQPIARAVVILNEEVTRVSDAGCVQP